jgi:hypothetical protein
VALLPIACPLRIIFRSWLKNFIDSMNFNRLTLW